MLVATLWLALVVAVPGPAAWIVTGDRRWRCWPRCCSATAPPGSASPTASSAPAGPTSRRATSAPSTPLDAEATRRVGRRRRRRPRLPAAAALPQARGAGARSPTRPTRRRTGWWHAPPRATSRRARRAGRRRSGGRARALTGYCSGHGIGQLQGSGPSSRWSAALGAAAVAKKAPRHVLEGRDRQEPAGEPRRPRRRDLGGRRLGRRQRRAVGRWPGCSPSAGPRTTTRGRPATCPRAAADGRPVRRPAAPDTHEGPVHLVGCRASAWARPRRSLRRSRGRSSSSRPPAGCGGGPGSSSCR